MPSSWHPLTSDGHIFLSVFAFQHVDIHMLLYPSLLFIHKTKLLPLFEEYNMITGGLATIQI
jgi:hypothetical protein